MVVTAAIPITTPKTVSPARILFLSKARKAMVRVVTRRLALNIWSAGGLTSSGGGGDVKSGDQLIAGA